jgi:3',5'-cyclic AMP phosphodiesterase CpdA
VKIAHLSDIHFGAQDPAATAALPGYLRSLQPDVVVISGDFTQRARAGQFAHAAEWVRSVGLPVLAVPGNHDLSVYAFWRRILFPLTRYERMAAVFSPSRDVLIPAPKILGRIDCAWRWDFPQFGWRFIGLNSARRLAADVRQPLTNGGLSERQIALVEREKSELAPNFSLAVIMHHPLGGVEQVPARAHEILNARHIRDRFQTAGVRLVLMGHWHRALPAGLRGKNEVVLSQAGTAISARMRGEAQSFNFISIDHGDDGIARISQKTWGGGRWS